MSDPLSNLTRKVAKYSTSIANRLERVNEKLHSKFGYERKIVIGEHKLHVVYKKKGHTGKYSGKSNYYANGELYLKGYANPIKIKPSEAEDKEIDLVSSQEYRNAVKNRIVQQALNTPDDSYDLAEKLLMGLLGLVGMAIAGGVVVYLQ